MRGIWGLMGCEYGWDLDSFPWWWMLVLWLLFFVAKISNLFQLNVLEFIYIENTIFMLLLMSWCLSLSLLHFEGAKWVKAKRECPTKLTSQPHCFSVIKQYKQKSKCIFWTLKIHNSVLFVIYLKY